MPTPTPTTSAELQEAGFLVRDNFLPQPLFDSLRTPVLAAWQRKEHWRTRVKGPGAPVTLPFQQGTGLAAIASLLDAERAARPHAFTYLYHVREEEAASGLTAQIHPHIVAGWADMLQALEISHRATQFALTAFGPHCYLDPHTDFSPNHAEPYQIALILYFQAAAMEQDASLQFDYMGKRARIAPLANRSVFFIPNRQTDHCVPQSPQAAAGPDMPRLAVSGWLI